MNFDYQTYGNTIHFGVGKLALMPDYLAPFQRLFIIGGKRLEGTIDAIVKGVYPKKCLVFSEVVQHVPETLVAKTFEVLTDFNPDAIVAIGGGSAIGLAKALALRKPLPIIAVPTTYSGSEQTNIYGITTENGKTTGRNPDVLPKIVIYDPKLTEALPVKLAVKSAMNAMAHLVEAIYSSTSNPLTQQIAVYGVGQIREGLEELSKAKRLSSAVNTKLLMGAYIGGRSLSEISMALHHKLAHVLGGTFNLDHASVHTVLQAYVLNYQWEYLSTDIQNIFAGCLDRHRPALVLQELAKNNGVETDLKSIGFKATDIERAAEIVVSSPYPNPAPITKDGMVNLLTNAYHGKLKV